MTDSQGIIGARYRLLERIGRGGMGTVWRARDEVLGREVAVKEVIPFPDLTGPEREVFTVRTLREARAAGRIGHPGVATVYDVIEEHGRPWIVMQLVDSRTLGAVIREDGPLPPARVARIGLEVLGALLAAHHAGVLHRDVKPDNVLLSKDGRAVLTDFGIAVLEGDSSITRTGSLIGTPAFIAPERASGGPAEFASDLWSLGVTLHLAVEGRSPFERAHPLATLSAVMHQEPPPLRFAGPLAPVIFGLLRKDPARRMSAQEAQVHLTSLVNGTAPQPTMPIELPPAVPVPAAALAGTPTAPAGTGRSGPEPGSAAAPGRRRRPVIAAMAAMALAVALTSAGMAWVAANSADRNPAGPPAPASVPSGKDTPTAEPERAKVPARNDPAGNDGASTRPAPERSGDGDPAPRDRPSDEPTDKPSGKPSGKPSQDGSEPPEEDSSDDRGEDDGGEGAEEGSGQGDAPGRGQQGDSPDQIAPDAGVAALGASARGRA
ncbi:protein kinase domain-containing protein [Streptosporangium sp. CA-115845]|uniref:serine/threonine-protein kinase n=1 Tax=Streptosporangium sp. CA-115845 TaxID=3240071 RepID=UPI003D8C0A34